jgi:hypothetical protein
MQRELFMKCDAAFILYRETDRPPGHPRSLCSQPAASSRVPACCSLFALASYTPPPHHHHPPLVLFLIWAVPQPPIVVYFYALSLFTICTVIPCPGRKASRTAVWLSLEFGRLTIFGAQRPAEVRTHPSKGQKKTSKPTRKCAQDDTHTAA